MIYKIDKCQLNKIDYDDSVSLKRVGEHQTEIKMEIFRRFK